MIKNIIFDFGGVILDFGKKHTLNVDQALAVIFEVPVDKISTYLDEYKSDLLIGKQDMRQFINFLKEELGSSKNLDELFAEFEKIHSIEYENINWELVKYIEKLKQNYKLYILSDAFNLGWDNPHYMEVIKLFDDVFNSYKTGFRKPDPQAYLNVLNKIEATPEECAFIDDTQKNVDAAEQLGIKSFLYSNLDKLKQDLELIN